MAPLPLKLVKIPPVTITSVATKFVEASLRANVTVAVCELLIVFKLLEMDIE